MDPLDPLAAEEALTMLTPCGSRELTPVKSRKWPVALFYRGRRKLTFAR
jgi:hypothetical protein